MHELPVTQSLLEIALRHAAQAGAQRINALHLAIGQYASVLDESINFYWEIIARDTIAQGATLVFRRIPAEMTCSQCRYTFQPDGETYACPACGGNQVKVTAGSEFFLESMDID